MSATHKLERNIANRILTAYLHSNGCIIKKYSQKEIKSLSDDFIASLFEICKAKSKGKLTDWAISEGINTPAKFRLGLVQPDLYVQSLGAKCEILSMFVCFSNEYSDSKNALKPVAVVILHDLCENTIAYFHEQFIDRGRRVPVVRQTLDYSKLIKFENENYNKSRPAYTVVKRSSDPDTDNYVTYLKKEHKGIANLQLICASKSGIIKALIFYALNDLSGRKSKTQRRYRYVFVDNTAKPKSVYKKMKHFYNTVLHGSSVTHMLMKIRTSDEEYKRMRIDADRQGISHHMLARNKDNRSSLNFSNFIPICKKHEVGQLEKSALGRALNITGSLKDICALYPYYQKDYPGVSVCK